MGDFLGENVGFKTCLGVCWVKMLVLQHMWVFLGVKMLVVQHAWLFLEWKYWFYNMFGRVCGEQVCFTAFLCVFWFQMLVLQHVWVIF